MRWSLIRVVSQEGDYCTKGTFIVAVYKTTLARCMDIDMVFLSEIAFCLLTY